MLRIKQSLYVKPNSCKPIKNYYKERVVIEARNFELVSKEANIQKINPPSPKKTRNCRNLLHNWTQNNYHNSKMNTLKGKKQGGNNKENHDQREESIIVSEKSPTSKTKNGKDE